MTDSDKTHPPQPVDMQQIGELIAAFDASTAKLKASHDALQGRIAELTGQLQKKNDELSRTLDEVSALKNSLASILESITDGVIAIGLNRRVVSLNTAASETLGELSGPVEGEPIDDVLPAGCEELGAILVQALLDRKRITNAEVFIDDGTGAPRTFSVSASPIRDEERGVIGAVETFRDLTGIKALEERAARQERLAALGEMAAGVAHEIRNPLGGIELYAGVARRNVDPDSKAAEMADKIMAAAASLNRIVTDMLTFTRAREPSLTSMPVEHVIRSAMELAAGPIEDKHIRVHYNFTTRGEPVKLDDEMLTQAFLNVILNAVQVMDADKHLSIQTDFTATDAGRDLIVRFIDQGPGIPEEARDKLFNPFFTLRKDGTGLGLAITHKIVQDHGGSITFEPTDDGGTAFIFRLPVNRTA